MRSLFLSLLLSSGCAAAPCQETPDIKEALKQPPNVFPTFQEYVRCGEYGSAYKCLSLNASKSLSYEEFYLGLTVFPPARRMIGVAQVHDVDSVGLKIRLCSAEFGIGREIRLARLGPAYFLDFTPNDISYLKNRALEWHRLQIERADGWHFAYPPDWTYAPLARTCMCRK